MALDRHQRPAAARGEQPFFDGAFEAIVMRDDQPIGIARRLRNSSGIGWPGVQICTGPLSTA